MPSLKRRGQPVPGQPTPGCACPQAAVDRQVGDSGWARGWTVTRPPTPSPLGSRLGLRSLSSVSPTLGSQGRGLGQWVQRTGGLSRPLSPPRVPRQGCIWGRKGLRTQVTSDGCPWCGSGHGAARGRRGRSLDAGHMWSLNVLAAEGAMSGTERGGETGDMPHLPPG